jgi:hypothetical protein
MRADRRGWTTATDHGRLEPASMCGYLLKVARLDARPRQRPGTPNVPAFDEELYTLRQTTDDLRMICACGADDVAGSTPARVQKTTISDDR